MSDGKKRVLTGVKPTGVPHMGNYLGAIRPAIELSRKMDSFLFIADLHALTIRPDPKQLIEESYCVAASWIAFGLDPEATVFYRQSDVPEIPTLAWCLSCALPMGLLNRAHSYKDARAKAGDDDKINHGLFSYPVLMAADILAFDTDGVPVGKDQKQHLEIAQEAARKLNHIYDQEILKIPEPFIDERVMTIPGTDGRKMSKSYDNTIQLFVDDKPLLKAIKRIKTNSTEYGDPLSTKEETVFAIYENIASPDQIAMLRAQYASGRKDPKVDDATLADPSSNYFGWGNAKRALYDLLIERFPKERQTYKDLMADKGHLDELLLRGAERARDVAGPVLSRVLEATGIRRA